MSNLLLNFIRESNRIEGILRDPTTEEHAAHNAFLMQEDITISDLRKFVSAVQPSAVLRDSPHLNVRVGNHIAPQGGPQIAVALEAILGLSRQGDPYIVHHHYETLHPFTDGNGRSGRVLWLWMMDRQGAEHAALRLGFLHLWYYQTLQHGRTPTLAQPQRSSGDRSENP